MKTELITGNTYPVKEQIKALGGTWSKLAQGWLVPEENAEKARELVANAGPSTYTPRPREDYKTRRRQSTWNRDNYVSNVTRFSSGTTVYTNKRGRCEDAPCCGCCS